MKCFKVKLRPTKEQEALLELFAYARLFAWNWAINVKQKEYEQYKATGEKGRLSGAYDLQRQFTALKNENPEYAWLTMVSKWVPQMAFADVDKAYRAAYKRGNKGFPEFKKQTKQTFSVQTVPKPNHDGYITIPIIGEIRTWRKAYVPLNIEISQATITKEADGWHISLLPSAREQKNIADNIEPTHSNVVVGIDMGCKTLCTLSNGDSYDHNKPALAKAFNRIIKNQRRLSRKTFGSQNYLKQKNKLARAWLKWSRIIKDQIEKATHEITKTYGVIGLETLDVKGMLENKPAGKRPKILNKRALNKSIAKASMAGFVNRIEQKAGQRNVDIIKADQRFPSTKTCSNCKNKQDMPLNKRTYECPTCGMVKDRDLNASINIELVAYEATKRQNITTASSAGIASGAQFSTVRRNRKPRCGIKSMNILDNSC